MEEQAVNGNPADQPACQPGARPSSAAHLAAVRNSSSVDKSAHQSDRRPNSAPYLAAARQHSTADQSASGPDSPSSSSDRATTHKRSPDGKPTHRPDCRPSSAPYLAAALDRSTADQPASEPVSEPSSAPEPSAAHNSAPAEQTGHQPDDRPSSAPYLAVARLNERFQQLRSDKLPQLLKRIGCTEEDLTDGPPEWSQKPWGFASKAGHFSAYLNSCSGTSKPSDDPEPEYLQHLHSSRAFFSPHGSEAMAEALGAAEAYGGLSGSLVTAPAHPDAVGDMRAQLKATIDRAWSDEALRHGVHYSNSGQYSEAVKSYNRALELCPSNLDARVAKGAALANQHHYSEAIAEFEAVLKVDSQNRNAISYLATVRVAAAAASGAGGGRQAGAPQSGSMEGHGIVGSGEAVKRALEVVTGQGKEKKSRKEKSRDKDRKKDKKAKGHKRDKDKRHSLDR